MKVERAIFAILLLFFVITTPIYWFMSKDPTGTTALALTLFLVLMITGYLTAVARGLKRPRPEDRKDGEIAEGAGELGFFSPHSIWPLYCAVAVALVALGIVFGAWISLIGFAFGLVALTGLVYEYYRGDHAH
ncbi:cytochrome c oxidase subunit 4 [Propionibacteriaceae bacterium Y1685]|uniref:cytochrome c oxidase subunit 4 n=1 Tax=Microlunatus sp. Y1700 TaxID=3418487 RepID=UPI003B812FCC